MRQVPAASTTSVGIVGDGRVARHFCRSLHPLDCPVRTWSRRASATRPTGDPFQAVYQAFARIYACR